MNTSSPYRCSFAQTFAVLLLGCWALCGFARVASACLNDYKPNPAGVARADAVNREILAGEPAEPWAARRDRLRKEVAANTDFRVRNDLANALMHTGEPAESVALLEAIEAEHPGLYMTAANLGTAYELNGNNQKALEWIGKGIERNPEAHKGSEWLHVRILEANLALASDPNWLENHWLLNGKPRQMDLPRRVFDEAALVAVGNRGESLTVDEVKQALIYQLHERLQFVKPPDLVVGALLLHLGQCISAETPRVGGELGPLNLALVYLKDAKGGDLLELEADLIRMDTRHRTAVRSNLSWMGSEPLMGLLTIVLAGGLMGYVLVKLKRRIERMGSRKDIA